ncbi:protein-s-isoprenylcysteine o-methyltransferase [Anaeramoeba flamelloides]|uniref:Protein-S-isoprenylcysteine O-methyltransferase n=1 Tax=Anaeramoeba flamelloides TaxID=1746091 RepID=A0ABQ8Z154_9EUKA|nr:protein-s-isoprenylcysteine o-methyltransferase [Anaeramoeba flamelloides]
MLETYLTVVMAITPLVMILVRLPYKINNLKKKIVMSDYPIYETILRNLAMITVLFPLVDTFTDFTKRFQLSIPMAVRLFCSFTLLMGLYVYSVSHFTLKDLWSPTVEIKKDHHLITNGIYQYIRHPMYLAGFLISISYFFVSQNYFSSFFINTFWFTLYFCRIEREEKLMRKVFGSQYIEYQKKTSRLFTFRNFLPFLKSVTFISLSKNPKKSN